MQIVVSCLAKDQTEGAQSVLETLIEIAESQPKFIKPHFDLFVDRLVQVCLTI